MCQISPSPKLHMSGQHSWIRVDHKRLLDGGIILMHKLLLATMATLFDLECKSLVQYTYNTLLDLSLQH